MQMYVFARVLSVLATFQLLSSAAAMFLHLVCYRYHKLSIMDIAVHWLKSPHRYWNSRAIWDHTVLPATRQRWHYRLYPSQSW